LLNLVTGPKLRDYIGNKVQENSGRQLRRGIKGGQLGEKVGEKLGEKVAEKTGEKVGESCVCPSVRLFVRVFTFEVPFKHLSAPTSRIWMSNIFEILGEK
jgi:hypothetical protein